MCIKILDSVGDIVTAEFQFLLKGGVVLNKEEQPENPCKSMLLCNGSKFRKVNM